MKKIFTLLVIFCIMLSMAGCSSDEKQTEQTEESTNVSTEAANPIYANSIKDGTYNIEVDSSSSMFRVVNCELTVENGAMQAVMTMSGQGYGALYMGTGEEALADSEDNHITAVINENGEKTFTVPVEALDMEIECAAWSIKKEMWYDRILVFKSEGIPKDALK